LTIVLFLVVFLLVVLFLIAPLLVVGLFAALALAACGFDPEQRPNSRGNAQPYGSHGAATGV
jgi:hypothetical protein